MTAKKENTQSTWIDPDDAPELNDDFFARAQWTIGDRIVSKEEAQQEIKKILRGRPAGSGSKQPATLRIDKEALARWRASGKGWQTRAAALLAKHAP